MTQCNFLKVHIYIIVSKLDSGSKRLVGGSICDILKLKMEHYVKVTSKLERLPPLILSGCCLNKSPS